MLQILQAALNAPIADRLGIPTALELLPALSPDEIDAFEATCPAPLPVELREFLAYCRGFRGGAVEMLDFTGQAFAFEFPEAFPHGVPIATDGCGNFWVVDLAPDSSTWGPVYYAANDPPVVLYQSAGVTEFLEDVLRLQKPPHENLIPAVENDAICKVWKTNPGVLTYEEALRSEDAELRHFAEQLGRAFQIIDLRSPVVGFGFSWGRYGPNTEVRRFGTRPIFAYKVRNGLLGRLLGKFG